MIDRRALWILILLCLAMTAAAIWRLSLLPDWTQLPMITPHGPRIRNGLVLLIPPFCLLLVLAVAFGAKWLAAGPDEAIQARQRLSRLMLVGTGIVMALAQAFNISRSLGYGVSLNAELVARTIMAVTGILVIMHGNALPKLPRLSKRFASLNLEPWQSARSRRFTGWMTVAFGLVVVNAAVLLPLRAAVPIILILTLGFYIAAIWNFVRLKREPSPQL